ncbi:hypothetical protein ACFY05_31745 [Microtetraspora fusca]|uniref:Uncharacterized protein n=1 Tax=Microtetraspora fusca TaxID=1997 RepID=A0ABW6VDK9_MICFU
MAEQATGNLMARAARLGYRIELHPMDGHLWRVDLLNAAGGLVDRRKDIDPAHIPDRIDKLLEANIPAATPPSPTTDKESQ